MIQCICQIEVSINERFDHLTLLTADTEQLPTLIKDQERKRGIVRNFRMIKSAQKARIILEQKYIKILEKLNKRLSKSQIIACQNMFANCMNQYLNSEYEVKKTGEPNDLIDIFIFYYTEINAVSKVNQLNVIKNCSLFYQMPFMSENLAFFLSNMQESINYVYETEKSRFFALIKSENRSLSPERKNEELQDEKFDATGKITTKTKRKLQLYCFQLSKLLNLEHIYLNYFYFSSMDIQKRKKALFANFLKRNVHNKHIADAYLKDYQYYQMGRLKTVQK